MVDDVLTTEDALQAEGWQTTGTDVSSAAWSETFLRPAQTFGALLQFVSTDKDWTTPTEQYDLEDVLSGRMVWRDYVACLR